MNTYTWEFPTLQTYRSYQGQQNVVYGVHWYLTGTDETGRYQYKQYGTEKVFTDVSGSNNFIPFDDITKENIQQWVELSMGAERIIQIKLDIDRGIAEQVEPPVERKDPPWIKKLALEKEKERGRKNAESFETPIGQPRPIIVSEEPAPEL